MQKSIFKSTLARIFMVTFLLALPLLTTDAWAATCVGADPCKACKNCKYCKHCAKDGKKCGTCK
jgi:hypothetical protein